MTLLPAIQAYIDMRQAHGIRFDKGAKEFRSFAGRVGDVPIDDIKPVQIRDFLNGPRTGVATWRKKFGLLKLFFEYWTARGLLDSSPMPPLRLPAAPTVEPYVPYVYTRNEVRVLLRGTTLWENSSWNNRETGRMDARTFRMFLLTLYATGMRTGEALHLLRKDVEVKRGTITIRDGRSGRVRKIPIGPDLCARLRRHKRDLASVPNESPYFFVGKDGKALNGIAVARAFRKLRSLTGVQRHDGAIYQPRMHDLRATFAVHRLTSWLRQKADLNRLIPALSAYMGQIGLGATERYLKLTPERFRTQLTKLSPQQRGRKHWRDDPALMKFLAEL